MSVAVHALLAADAAVVQVSVGRVVFEEGVFLDDRVFREEGFCELVGVVEVLDGPGAGGVDGDLPVGPLAERGVALDVAARVAVGERLQVLRAYATIGSQTDVTPLLVPAAALTLRGPVGDRPFSLLCFTIRRQLPHASLFIPTVE